MRGYICQKGVMSCRQPYNEKRLLYPLKRAGERGEGKWERISWDQALDEIAAKLLDLRERYGIDDGRDDPATGWVDESTIYDNWEFMVMAQLQFNEQFGFDLGAQGFWGDNAEPAAPNVVGDLSFDSLWTIFAGVRFNFTDSVAFKGIYYKQSIDADRWDGVIWRNAYPNTDDPSAFKLIVDVKQEALKFTSLWLEYGQMDRNFTVPAEIADNGALFTNSTRNFVDLDPVTNTVTRRGFGAVQWLGDLKYWRIAAGQEWNEKWATHFLSYPSTHSLLEAKV